MHYYQHHIGDFLKATSGMTAQQSMCYLRLIWDYYDTEQPLPDTPRVLALKVGATVEEVELVLEAFFTKVDGVWTHARCDQVIADFHKFCEDQRTRGKKGGRPKKNPPGSRGVTDGMPTDTRGEAVGNPTHYPLPNSSVSKDTDGKPSPDEIIFGYGVPLLTNAGTPDKQARSFLGGLRKSHGDAALVNALRDCIREKPLQPLEWLAAVLPPSGVKPKENRQESLEARNRAVVARLLAKEAASAGL